MGKPHPHQGAECDLEFTGRLTSNAHAAQKQTDQAGHFAPALCLELRMPNGARCHVQQYFSHDRQKECEEAAKALRTGMEVTFVVPLSGLYLKALGARSVTATPLEEEPGLFTDAAASASATPAPAHP